MLDPAGQVAWSHGATALCLHLLLLRRTNLQHLSVFIGQMVPVDLVVYTMYLLYTFFLVGMSALLWTCYEEEMKIRQKISALDCSPLTGPHIVAGQWTCSESVQVHD